LYNFIIIIIIINKNILPWHDFRLASTFGFNTCQSLSPKQLWSQRFAELARIKLWMEFLFR